MGRRKENEDLKAARGTLRDDRKGKSVEFTPLQTKRYAPRELVDDYAKNEYRKVTEKLIDDGLAAEIDDALIVAYCNEISKYMKLSAELYDDPEPPKGKAYECTVALKNAVQIGVLLGITPGARGKIKPQKPKGKEDNPAEQAANKLAQLRKLAG